MPSPKQHSAATSPIGVGIVGLGFMAATHLKAYRQITDYRIAAICNPSGRNLDGDFSKVAGNIGSTEALKLDMSRVKPYRRFADLLADPAVQLVDICAPTPAHPELAIAALTAGKHVICEKPLEIQLDRIDRMNEVAQKNKVGLAGIFQNRWNPSNQALKQAMVDGRFGTLAFAGCWAGLSFWRGTGSQTFAR